MSQQLGKTRVSASVVTALSWMTVLPFPQSHRAPTRRQAGLAMTFMPLVGAVCGALACLVAWAFSYLWGSWVAAAATVIVLALFTRGMHVDGVADTIDGLGSYGDADRAVEIMKSGPVGPMGSAAISAVFILQICCLQLLIAAQMWPAVILVFITSRYAVVIALATRQPVVGTDGFGAMVANSQSWLRIMLATCGVIGCGATLNQWALSYSLTSLPHLGWLIASHLALVVVLWVVVTILSRHVLHRFGSLHGDHLGFMIECAAIICLLWASSGLL